MIRMVVRGKVAEPTRAFAQTLGERFREAAAQLVTGETPEIRILGPAAAPFAKLRGMHRFHLQLHGADRDLLRNVIRRGTVDLEVPDGMQWTADVDPLDML